jgi:hypothetical protein
MAHPQSGSQAPDAPLSVPELHQHIARELRRGKSQDDLVRYLGTRGWPEVTARPFVANAAKSLQYPPTPSEGQPEQRLQPNKLSNTPANTPAQANAGIYKQRMIRGLLWILAGIGLTLVANDIARSMFGTGVVFVFAIFFGFIDFVLGLRGWLQHRK